MTAFQQSDVITPVIHALLGRLQRFIRRETNALACLIGGLYLCIRRTASWEIPASMIGMVLVMATLVTLASDSGWHQLHHLFSGALLFGAFFIATDPVSSPLTPKGKLIFGAGVGFITMGVAYLQRIPGRG